MDYSSFVGSKVYVPGESEPWTVFSYLGENAHGTPMFRVATDAAQRDYAAHNLFLMTTDGVVPLLGPKGDDGLPTPDTRPGAMVSGVNPVSAAPNATAPRAGGPVSSIEGDPQPESEEALEARIDAMRVAWEARQREYQTSQQVHVVMSPDDRARFEAFREWERTHTQGQLGPVAATPDRPDYDAVAIEAEGKRSPETQVRNVPEWAARFGRTPEWDRALGEMANPGVNPESPESPEEYAERSRSEDSARSRKAIADGAKDPGTVDPADAPGTREYDAKHGTGEE